MQGEPDVTTGVVCGVAPGFVHYGNDKEGPHPCLAVAQLSQPQGPVHPVPVWFQPLPFQLHCSRAGPQDIRAGGVERQSPGCRWRGT